MIDLNEAPEGFIAKPGDTCDGCWFFANNEQGCPDVECHQSSRKDGEDVIFVPREKSNLGEHGDELQKAKDEAARWKAACLERDELIAKIKAQLTTALEAIARMR